MTTPTQIAEIAESYCAAWREPDPARRRELLDRAWADDGVYQDPTGRVEGRVALDGHIAGFAQRFPGARIEMTSGVDGYEDKFRFAWVMLDANGAQIMEGVDFGRLAGDGRIASITGFFGHWPPRRA